MQYGNYASVEQEDEKRKGFKSYYVVWKPYKMKHFMLLLCLFKSYYVVWKPNIIIKKYKMPRFSLNRTMQYGNKKYS